MKSAGGGGTRLGIPASDVSYRLDVMDCPDVAPIG